MRSIRRWQFINTSDQFDLKHRCGSILFKTHTHTHTHRHETWPYVNSLHLAGHVTVSLCHSHSLSHLYFMLLWRPRASFIWAWPNKVCLFTGSALTFDWQVGALPVFNATRRSFSGYSLAPPLPPPPPPTLQAMDTCILVATVTSFTVSKHYVEPATAAKVAGCYGDDGKNSWVGC